MNAYPVWYLIFYPGVFLMIVLGGLVVMVVVGTAALLWYDAMERRRAVRMAEAKVVSSELILRADIETLRRARSPLVGRGHSTSGAGRPKSTGAGRGCRSPPDDPRHRRMARCQAGL